MLAGKFQGLGANPVVKLLMTTLVHHPDARFIHSKEADDILFGLIAHSNDPAGMPCSILRLLGINIPVERLVKFGSFHKDQVVYGNDRPDHGLMDAKGNFVGKSMVYIHAILLQLICQPECFASMFGIVCPA